MGAQGLRVSIDGALLYVGDFHRPLLHVVDLESRKVVETVSLTGVPGWPYPTPDGRYVVMSTYDEPGDRGYVEILRRDDLTDRRVVEVPAEPFHALAAGDGTHLYVALGDGEIPRIDLESARVVDGGLNAGGSMPEAIVFIEA